MLITLLLLPCFTVGAAPSFKGSGTSSSPYLISSADDLRSLSSSVASGTSYNGKRFKLTENIDLRFRAFTPIGTSTNSFSGTFDGNGKYIDNLVCTRTNGAGLFGYTDGAKISDLLLMGAVSSGSMQSSVSGALIAYGKNTAVEDCITRVTVISRMSEFATTPEYHSVAGGIIGIADGCTVSGCSVQSTVDAAFASTSAQFTEYCVAGGIVGAAVNGTRIKSSFTLGTVNAYGSYSGTVAYSGGLAGYIDASSSVENSYNVYSVQCRSALRGYIGGLAGFCEGKLANCYTLEIPAVVTMGITVGYFTGRKSDTAQITNCYFRTVGIVGSFVNQGTDCGYFTYRDSTVKSSSGKININGRVYSDISLETALDTWVSGKSGYSSWSVYEEVNSGYPVLPSTVTTVTGKANFGGKISPDGVSRLYKGTSVTFTPTPDEGYIQGKVTLDGKQTELAIAGNLTLSNVMEPHTVETFFEPKDYTIAATSGLGGTISPAGNTTVKRGGSATYTITADKGYKIDRVEVDGKSIGAVSTYTFKNVTKACTIIAYFTKTGSGGGSSTPVVPPTPDDTKPGITPSDTDPVSPDTDSAPEYVTDERGAYVTDENGQLIPVEDADIPADTSESGEETDEDGAVITYIAQKDTDPDTRELPPINTEGKSKMPLIIFVCSCVVLIGGGLLIAYIVSKAKESREM